MLFLSDDRNTRILRAHICALIIVLLFGTIIVRLWFLQMVKGDNLLKAAEANRVKVVHIRAPRGSILDNRGRVIATSTPRFTVMAIPSELKENKKAMDLLSSILEMTPEEILFEAHKTQIREGLPTCIAMDVSLDKVARIGERRMDLPNVSVELTQVRNYPDGRLYAHIMGSIGEVSKETYDKFAGTDKPYRLGDYVGKAGLESQYEDLLRGSDGGKRVEVNAAGRVVRTLGEKKSVPGATLTLTVDRDLQKTAVKALGGQVGSVVALNPKTGAVLAMANSPSYDPNLFVKRINSKDWNAIINNKHHPLQNRAVNNVYPPGSTFKPVMCIAGLKNNLCTAATTAACPGFFKYGRRFGCWSTHGGGVDMNRAIAESCDVWFYKLGLKLGIDRIAATGREFGLGKATGIDLPGENRYKDKHVGTMPTSKWKRDRFKKAENRRWNPGDTINCSIGQGFVETSPLQMALVAAACGTGGKVYRPYLVDEIRDPETGKLIKRTIPKMNSKVSASKAQFDALKRAMRRTVVSGRGTGKVADLPGVYVCAKTGSAETRGAAHGWFICFAAPDENSDADIAVACIIEHGKHGGEAAGPVCKAILDTYYERNKKTETETEE